MRLFLKPSFDLIKTVIFSFVNTVQCPIDNTISEITDLVRPQTAVTYFQVVTYSRQYVVGAALYLVIQ